MTNTILDMTVAGIPAKIEILSASPGRPAQTYGPPEKCYPGEPPEIEYRILDRRGRPAPWLERKIEGTREEDDLYDRVGNALAARYPDPYEGYQPPEY